MTAGHVVAALVVLGITGMLWAVALSGRQWLRHRVEPAVSVGQAPDPEATQPLLWAVHIERPGVSEHIAMEDYDDVRIWLGNYLPWLDRGDWGISTVEVCSWPGTAAAHSLDLRERLGHVHWLDGAS